MIRENKKLRHVSVTRLILAALVTMYMGAINGCQDSRQKSSGPAPDFVLQDLAGERFYLSGNRDNIILLNFWSVHCVPCLQEMPELERLWSAYRSKRVIVAGICNDPREAGYISTFVKGHGVSYPILMDTDSKVNKRYKVEALPTTIIIDGTGNIQYRATGYARGQVQVMKSVIDGLLSGG